MKEKEFISYIKGLTDMEISRVKGMNGTPVGYLKLVETALAKLDNSQYYYSNTTWDLNPKFTSTEKERTKEELNTLNQQIKQQLND